MTIEDHNEIDFIHADSENPEIVVMAIIDHLPWNTDSEYDHLQQLQEKLHRYLDFVENREMSDRFPDFEKHKIIIRIITSYAFNDRAKEFFNAFRKYACEFVFDLQFSLSDESNSIER